MANRDYLNDLPNVHPRLFIVQEAKSDLATALVAATKKFNLTPIEIIRMLVEEIQYYSLYILRAERHPEDPSKKADEE